jgi:DEAD/DEAH box helicase domain-containing protein
MREQLLSRVGTLLLNVAPFFLLCDKHDMGISERVRDPHFELPALYFYDKYPGGIGLAEGFTEKLSEILTAALEVVSGCPCTGGCPSCIGPESSSSEVYAVSEEVNLKELAVKFLRQFGE